eukprot:gene10964-12190_t
MKLPKAFRMRENFLERLHERGFTADDIPKAILIHEVLGIFMLALTWSLCYCLPLSTHPFFKKPLDRMAQRMPALVSRSIESNPFLSHFLGSRFGVAYVESSCL